MNQRLEIASRLLAGFFAHGWTVKDDVNRALQLADQLIAKERETRPPCKHSWLVGTCEEYEFLHCELCGESKQTKPTVEGP